MSAKRHAALRLGGKVNDFLTSTGIRPIGTGVATYGNLIAFHGRITPTSCKTILQNYNDHNRLRRDATVLPYAQAMEDKEWENNGVPLLFDENGQLLDGQHRLEGAFVSKKTMTVLLVFGVPFSTFLTLDAGIKRKLADHLHTMDFAWSNDRAKLAGLIFREMNENLLVKTHAGPSSPELKVGTAIATGDEYGDKITRALHFVYGISYQWKPKKLFSRSEGAFFFMKLEAIDQAAGVEYLHHLITGTVPVGSSADHVSSAVRNRLIAIDSKDKDARAMRFLAISAGWNRWCTAGNGVVRDYRVPVLRKKNGDAKLTVMPALKSPNRKVKTASAAWFLAHSNFDGIMVTGERRAESTLQKIKDRLKDVDTRAERMRELLTEDE